MAAAVSRALLALALALALACASAAVTEGDYLSGKLKCVHHAGAAGLVIASHGGFIGEKKGCKLFFNKWIKSDGYVTVPDNSAIYFYTNEGSYGLKGTASTIFSLADKAVTDAGIKVQDARQKAKADLKQTILDQVQEVQKQVNQWKTQLDSLKKSVSLDVLPHSDAEVDPDKCDINGKELADKIEKFEKDIALMTDQADKAQPNEGSLRYVFERAPAGSRVLNYGLGKLEEFDQLLADAKAEKAPYNTDKLDLCLPAGDVTLRQVIEALAAAGKKYPYMHGVFCRVHSLNGGKTWLNDAVLQPDPKKGKQNNVKLVSTKAFF